MRAQDEHPALPEAISPELRAFLLACFAKDPQARPGAAALLRHAWLSRQRATLRASWPRGSTAGQNRPRGGAARTDALANVSAVVERILQARARSPRVHALVILFGCCMRFRCHRHT